MISGFTSVAFVTMPWKRPHIHLRAQQFILIYRGTANLYTLPCRHTHILNSATELGWESNRCEIPYD